MPRVRVHMTIPATLLAEARNAAGDLPLSRYFERALRSQLKTDEQLREVLASVVGEVSP